MVQVGTSNRMANRPGGQRRQNCSVQGNLEPAEVFFWQRRGRSVAEFSLSLKTCRPDTVSTKARAVGSVLSVQNALEEEENTRGRKGEITESPHNNVLEPTLNWVIENQPMLLVILTQPSSRK